MSQGKELFDRIQDQRYQYGVGSEEWTYAQTLRTALLCFGPDRMFALLEESERAGKRIKMVNDLAVGGSPVDMVVM